MAFSIPRQAQLFPYTRTSDGVNVKLCYHVLGAAAPLLLRCSMRPWSWSHPRRAGEMSIVMMLSLWREGWEDRREHIEGKGRAREVQWEQGQPGERVERGEFRDHDRFLICAKKVIDSSLWIRKFTVLDSLSHCVDVCACLLGSNVYM